MSNPYYDDEYDEEEMARLEYQEAECAGIWLVEATGKCIGSDDICGGWGFSCGWECCPNLHLWQPDDETE